MEISDNMSESANMNECLDSGTLEQAQVETREMGRMPPYPTLLKWVKESMFNLMSAKSSILSNKLD